MCDTFVILGNATIDGTVIFGKNSDREPNEAHEIKIFPAADYPEGSFVQCTYRSIPQAPHTNAVLLAKPFWIWGAEMGVNEFGVTIGNEAVFTRVPYETENGLIGMDFLRLALERSKTAWEALYTITQLLETYGQSGNCGFTHPFTYHNSFILADPQEAWVLETAGRQWAAEKVKNIRSISNAPTIGKTWDLSSDDLVSFAKDQGWCKGKHDFHFARCYSDFTYTTLSNARERQSCTMQLLRDQQELIGVRTAMDVLRAHGVSHPSKIRLDAGLLGATVCMHAGAGPVRTSQSVGSLVAQLTPGIQNCWVTATSAPCTSIFKPVWLDSGYPLDEPAPSGTFDQRCLWWRHEKLHRAVLLDYSGRMGLYRSERDQLEEAFLNEFSELANQNATARRAFSTRCFQAAEDATRAWLEKVQASAARKSLFFYYDSAWKGYNQQAGTDFAE